VPATPDPRPPIANHGAIEGAWKGLCPRCGEATLFDGVAQIAETCRSCRLDFTRFKVGERLAALLTLLLAAVIAALAITLEVTLHPPLLLQLILWIPLTAGAVILALRLFKGVLLSLSYREQNNHSGTEGQA
jgi:uncharacterized protein (DUF983 family)